LVPRILQFPRIYLLPDAEIDDLYERPIFNKNEQLLYLGGTTKAGENRIRRT
jgi:hypothetical protein